MSRHSTTATPRHIGTRRPELPLSVYYPRHAGDRDPLTSRTLSTLSASPVR
jgi:hypothetical protein